MLKGKKLENLSRDELLQTVRRLLAEADALSSRIAAVNEIGLAINETLDLDKILHVVAKQSKWLLDYQHLSLCLHQDETWEFIGLFGAVEDTHTIDWEATENVGRAIRTRQAQLIQEGTSSDFLSCYPSQIIIPLKVEHELIGTINFAAKAPQHYTQDDMRIGYMLSLQIAAAIRNANIVKQLQDTQAELNLRIEDLDAYNHTIAHDLKSPLAGINLSSQIVQRFLPDNTPQKVRDYVDMIQLSGKQMASMIDQLLVLAKLRNLENTTQSVDVTEIVQNARVRFAHAIEEQNISLVIDDNLPQAMGHAQWVEEVFANLISNAIKYMGENNPQPSIHVQAQIEDDRVRYSVCDTGIGIKAEDQQRLFDMFSRVGDTDVEGLGLGLSIVRRIITRLGGELGVESTYGEGSTFWFTLPFAPQIQPEQP